MREGATDGVSVDAGPGAATSPGLFIAPAGIGWTLAGRRTMMPAFRYMAWWTDPGRARVSAGVFR